MKIRAFSSVDHVTALSPCYGLLSFLLHPLLLLILLLLLEFLFFLFFSPSTTSFIFYRWSLYLPLKSTRMSQCTLAVLSLFLPHPSSSLSLYLSIFYSQSRSIDRDPSHSLLLSFRTYETYDYKNIVHDQHRTKRWKKNE